MTDLSRERLLSPRASSSSSDHDPVTDNGSYDYRRKDADGGLPLPLKFLFALNGFSLAFPVTALLYIVNTRVEMSIALLPTYGAIAFLPNSLRPLYAYFSHTCFRDRLIALLLIASALSIAATALIPKHGVMLCFIIGFLRGVTSSWPEFLLGLTLVDLARFETKDYEKTCAVFQAQAATSRHIGSLVASIGALVIVSRHHFLEAHTMNLLLFVSAMANFIGAIIALYYRVGRQQIHAVEPSSTGLPNYQSISTTDVEVGESFLSKNQKVSMCRIATNYNVLLVLLLQITVVLLALRQPIEGMLSPMGWRALSCTSIAALMLSFTAAVWSGQWEHSQKVGLFLILRHVTPSASYLMSSYLYDVFASAPYLLQLLSLVDTAISTAAAWSYGKFWSKFSSEVALPLLIFSMTILASLISLAQVWLVHILPVLSNTPLVQFGIVIVVQGIVNWTGMWNFMPDVVLATTSIKHTAVQSNASSDSVKGINTTVSSGQGGVIVTNIREAEEAVQEQHSRNMQYGTLISCIDFGDQLGALVLGALVAALDVSRENDWDRLDDLIQLCALIGAFSAVFICILK